ncbi:Prephenate dehydratase [Melampsora americana]|nr:Prephenate dehydratase [Melampsora americana]
MSSSTLNPHQTSNAQDRIVGIPKACHEVAFLGPIGTYTHEASLQRFSGPKFILKPYPDIRTVIYSLLAKDQDQDQTLSANSTWASVVPIRNSTAGPVLETEEVLAEAEVARQILRLDDQIILKIEHCLVRRRQEAKEERTSGEQDYQLVASHTQALQQCDQYLRKHYPNIRRQETSSTAQAARLVADDTTGRTLAICSPTCASIFHSLEILDTEIQDTGIGR